MLSTDNGVLVAIRYKQMKMLYLKFHIYIFRNLFSNNTHMYNWNYVVNMRVELLIKTLYWGD